MSQGRWWRWQLLKTDELCLVLTDAAAFPNLVWNKLLLSPSSTGEDHGNELNSGRTVACVCGVVWGVVKGFTEHLKGLRKKKSNNTFVHCSPKKKKIFLYLNHVNSLPSIHHENTVLFLTFCNIFSKSKKQKEHFFYFLTQPGKLRTMNYRRKREGGILSLCWYWSVKVLHFSLNLKKKTKKTESIRCPCSRHPPHKNKTSPSELIYICTLPISKKTFEGGFYTGF